MYLYFRCYHFFSIVSIFLTEHRKRDINCRKMYLVQYSLFLSCHYYVTSFPKLANVIETPISGAPNWSPYLIVYVVLCSFNSFEKKGCFELFGVVFIIICLSFPHYYIFFVIKLWIKITLSPMFVSFDTVVWCQYHFHYFHVAASSALASLHWLLKILLQNPVKTILMSKTMKVSGNFLTGSSTTNIVSWSFQYN